MLAEIDFRSIRPWKHSRHSGFEELCCQLYALDPPVPGSAFARKEGAGGDAGLECFWILPDGSVRGLQSKYFLDRLRDQEWRQVDESVRSALQNHPTLVHITICMPRDLADRRVLRARSGQDGQREVSQRDHWNIRVEKWRGWAEGMGRTVEFAFWGSAEIGELLTRDDPLYAGRTLYWFGNRALTTEWFKHHFEAACKNLDRRYTPQADVRVPIAAVFDGLGRTPAFGNRLRQLRRALHEAYSHLINALPSAGPGAPFDCAALSSALIRVDSLLDDDHLSPGKQLPIQALENAVEDAERALNHLDDQLVNHHPAASKGPAHQDDSLKSARFYARQLFHQLRGAASDLGSDLIAAADTGAVLIEGEAGVGKSHLLADIAKSRLEAGLPTLLLLGQHVVMGNPWETFLSELDLKSQPIEQVLGALDAAGQAAGGRALILIDAINEGGGRQVWRDRLPGFLDTIARFPYVASALTCRSTYVDAIVPPSLGPETLTRVEHHGFEGIESRAADVYLDTYGITRPNTPLLAPEFSNPLFLKTCCEALQREGKNAFPKGMGGIKRIFELYLDSLDSILRERMDVDPRDHLARKALRCIAEELARAGSGSLPRYRAKELLDRLHPVEGYRASLLHHLIAEGALAEDLEYSYAPGEDAQDVIRFTFERFSDHFIAERLLDEHVGDGSIEAALAPEGALGSLLRGEQRWRLRGVSEALAVQVPERYGRELLPFLVDNGRIDHRTRQAFLNSIIWREPDACTEETAKWLPIASNGWGEDLWRTVLHVAVEPSHPFNADRLHRNLMGVSLPARDQAWSVYLAQNYDNFEDDEPESIPRTLIRWAWDGNRSGAEDETIRLCAVTLVWFFTTSNRAARDHATKAVATLLSERSHLAVGLLEKFEGVNDPYVEERLLASIYGAVLQGVPARDLTDIASAVYARIFAGEYPPPHVLLRDYARGIVEYAASRGCLSPEVDIERARPPYRSDEWPLDIPTEPDSYTCDPIRGSVLNGDFGRYVMGASSEWSVTALTESHPLTYADVVRAFLERLDTDPNAALKSAFRHLEAVAARTEKSTLRSHNPAHLLEALSGPEPVDHAAGGPEMAAAERAFLALLPEDEHAHYTREVAPYLPWGWSAHRPDRPVYFDIRAERRWVWQRALSFGWTEERFREFERMRSGGRSEHRVERIGKKYQWIAWHEMQARMSDHLHFLGTGWSDQNYTKYEGPWQLNARDIDPSLLTHIGDTDARVSYPGHVWWRPDAVVHPRRHTTEQRIAALWSEDGFPDVKKLLCVRDPHGQEWLLLEGMSVWDDHDENRDTGPRRDTWVRIQSFIVARRNVPAVIKALRGEDLGDHFELTASVPSDVFLGEYPWHPACGELETWRVPEFVSEFRRIPVPFIVPCVEYSCESGRDQSFDGRFELKLPSPYLWERMELHCTGGRSLAFAGPDDRVLLFDPSTLADGPPAALVARERLLEVLEEDELALIWRVNGEKGLFGRGMSDEYHGRQVRCGVFSLDGGVIRGEMWTKNEPPDR